jgi:hypothetical protein
MRTKRASDTHPCAQRTLRRVCQWCVDRFSILQTVITGQ